MTSTAAPPPSPSSSASSVKNFEVPDYLKVPEIGITSIVLMQRNLIVRYHVSDDMKGEFKVLITGEWQDDSFQLHDKAARKGFVFDNIQLMEKAFNHIYSVEAVDEIAKIKAYVKKEAEAKKNRAAANAVENDDKKPKVIKHYVHKYHDPSGGLELYEAILLGNEAHFISINRDKEEIDWDLSTGFSITDSSSSSSNGTVTQILPIENLGYISKAFRFESENEIDQYFQKAKKLTLDQVYNLVKRVVKKYIAGSDTHHTILSGDIIFTYYQDVFGQTHYLFFYGDNGTGKTINLHLIEQIAYRVMFDVDITPANIYTFYGTIEEGQGVICEDEADDLDYKQTEKMKIYKKGYTKGGKVTRTETGGSDGRVQEGFYVYGFKAFTGEEKLDPDYAKGLNERIFYIECEEGDPEYDLTEVLNPAGEGEYEELLAELADLHKTLLMFRLIHHTDKYPNIDVAVKNREKQLIKPLVRLFQGTQALGEISTALGTLLSKRRGIKRDTLEYAIYTVLNKRVDEYISSKKTECELRKMPFVEPEIFEFAAKAIYTDLRVELDGHYPKDDNKDQSFETPIHGKVSHKKITQVCEGRFGADIKHSKSGNMMVFKKNHFAKVKAAYSLSDSGVQIINAKEADSSVKVVKDVKDSEDVGQGVKEKEADIGDGNRTETEENVGISEEMEEEYEESEEEEEEESV